MKFGEKIATIAGRCLKNKPQSQSKKRNISFISASFCEHSIFLAATILQLILIHQKHVYYFVDLLSKCLMNIVIMRELYFFLRLVDSVSASVDEMTIISLDKLFISIIFIGCHFKTSNLHFVFILNGDIQGLP